MSQARPAAAQSRREERLRVKLYARLKGVFDVIDAGPISVRFAARRLAEALTDFVEAKDVVGEIN